MELRRETWAGLSSQVRAGIDAGKTSRATIENVKGMPVSCSSGHPLQDEQSRSHTGRPLLSTALISAMKFPVTLSTSGSETGVGQGSSAPH